MPPPHLGIAELHYMRFLFLGLDTLEEPFTAIMDKDSAIRCCKLFYVSLLFCRFLMADVSYCLLPRTDKSRIVTVNHCLVATGKFFLRLYEHSCVVPISDIKDSRTEIRKIGKKMKNCSCSTQKPSSVHSEFVIFYHQNFESK